MLTWPGLCPCKRGQISVNCNVVRSLSILTWSGLYLTVARSLSILMRSGLSASPQGQHNLISIIASACTLFVRLRASSRGHERTNYHTVMVVNITLGRMCVNGYLTHTWSTNGAHMVHTFSTHGPHMVHTWSTHGAHMVFTWSTHNPHMVYMVHT